MNQNAPQQVAPVFVLRSFDSKICHIVANYSIV